jgi:hypothetical protein
MKQGAMATDNAAKLNKIAVLRRRHQVLSIYPRVGGREVWAVTALDDEQAETCLMLREEY